MKAIYLTKFGDAATSFEQREIPKPSPAKGQLLLKVQASGLNFADVQARRGNYKEAPPLPCILGYDVAGTVEEIGTDVSGFNKGDVVMALTRFGGYAEYAITEALATAKIPAGIDTAAATALATQCCTAYYASAVVTNLYPGDKVLIQSGAGGVGSALIQYAKYIGCEIFATAGSSEKISHLEKIGVHHPINYRTHNFEEEIIKIAGKKSIDAVFDAVGGKSVKKGIRLLNAGGRLVCYGVADINNKNIFGKIKTILDFGFYHPAFLMMPSKSIIGINMLKIADFKPQIMQYCLQQVSILCDKGVFKPETGKVFKAEEIGLAHEYLENRLSIGKVAIKW